MAGDFEKMAAQARAAHAARVAAQDAKSSAEREAKSKWVDAASAFLDSLVLPTLERAKTELNKSGISSQIEKQYDVKMYTAPIKPKLVFKCLGPPRTSDGWRFVVPPIFFSSDGETIEAGIAENSLDREPKKSIGKAHATDIEALISRAVEKEIEAYYVELEKHR